MFTSGTTEWDLKTISYRGVNTKHCYANLNSVYISKLYIKNNQNVSQFHKQVNCTKTDRSYHKISVSVIGFATLELHLQ
jgi:hypothetical protein